MRLGIGIGLGSSSSGLALGPELVTNGTFDTDLTGWTFPSGGWAWNSGKAELTGSGSVQSFNQSSVMTIGVTYQISFDVSSTGGEIGVQNASSAIVESGDSGTVTFTWVADRESLSFKRVSGTVNGTLDNISVREVL